MRYPSLYYFFRKVRKASSSDTVQCTRLSRAPWRHCLWMRARFLVMPTQSGRKPWKHSPIVRLGLQRHPASFQGPPASGGSEWGKTTSRCAARNQTATDAFSATTWVSKTRASAVPPHKLPSTQNNLGLSCQNRTCTTSSSMYKAPTVPRTPPAFGRRFDRNACQNRDSPR